MKMYNFPIGTTLSKRTHLSRSGTKLSLISLTDADAHASAAYKIPHIW